MQTNLHFCAIGYGFSVCANKVRLVAPTKPKQVARLVREAKKENRVMDASGRHKTRSVLVLDDNTVVLSPFNPETVLARITKATQDFMSMVPPFDDTDVAEDDDEEEFDVPDDDGNEEDE